ncbi:hypothetical protein HA402_000795 [Bradysia odoriphaga]|nr:hypothetical protein HA402_000795 [Bradysia odoriphaga]
MACGLETVSSEQVDENIRSIQDVCFFLKTFCSEIELHTQLLKSKSKQEIDSDVIEDMMSEVDTEYQMPDNPNEIYPVEVYPEIFDYKAIDPSMFVAGDTDEFFISFIKDDASFLFFMMNASSADVVIQQPEFRYDIIPSKGTVFGLLLDGVIFRAVRENSLPITSFFSSMACGLETVSSEQVDENIRSIQDVCFFLKTFCSEIELHTQLLKSKSKQEIDSDVIEDMMSEVDTEYQMPDNPNEIYPVEVYPEIFDYKAIDPSMFVAGDTDEFFISFIKDDASFLFFMMNASSADVVIQQPEFRYDIIPSKGTVFGLLLDGVIFRAVRENSLPTRPKSIKVFLIDVGEIVEITKDYKMYRLTEDMQQTPGQSIYCKLSVDDDSGHLDDENYLRDKLFTKQVIRINRVYKNMLEVSIIPQSTQAAPSRSLQAIFPRSSQAVLPGSSQAINTRSTQATTLSSSNSDTSTIFTSRNSKLKTLSNGRTPSETMPPLVRNHGNNTMMNGNSSAVSSNSSVVSGNSTVVSGNSTVVSGNSTVVSGNSTVVSGNSTVVSGNSTMVSGNSALVSGKSAVANGKRSVVNGNNSLTQEELDELYEEPLNTENAMVAVMGYNPQDDRRICKFTDPKTNACFKGRHCKLEHTTKLKDGWTKDQRIFKSSIHCQMPMPKVGKKVQMFVQYVDDIDKFYCHIVPKNCKNADDLPAEHIFEKINDPKTTAKFRKCLVAPAEFELVFALFEEGWYRARIMQKFSEVEYRVFFVDYGNCQTKHINDLRRWDDAFDCYSFQAVECKLDNIIKLKKKDVNAVAFFEKLVFRKAVTATVTSNAGILLITMEYQGYDVGEQLCAAGFATVKPITRIHNGMYPG